jgi:hypothetical protein
MFTPFPPAPPPHFPNPSNINAPAKLARSVHAFNAEP